jgi:hypothetical protein
MRNEVCTNDFSRWRSTLDVIEIIEDRYKPQRHFVGGFQLLRRKLSLTVEGPEFQKIQVLSAACNCR